MENYNYKVIARQFGVGKPPMVKTHFGIVVVSSEALFFVSVLGGNAALVGGAIGGAIGGLVAGALGKGPHKSGDIDLSELPSEVADDPSWPVKQKKGRVFVLPREDVASIRRRWWGSIHVDTCGGQSFYIHPAIPFCNGAMLRIFTDFRWRIR